MNKIALGIILATGPAASATETAIRLARASAEMGKHTKIFLFDEGIHNAIECHSTKSILRIFHRLAEVGVEISACKNMAKIRGVTQSNVSPVVALETLIEFNDIMVNSERVLIFSKVNTPGRTYA